MRESSWARGRWLVAPLFVALIATASPDARAADAVWTVLPFTARGVDEASVQTFRDLLQAELASRTHAPFVGGDASCADVPCAATEAGNLGASVAVYGALARLGEKIVVTATLVDVPSGEVLNSDRATVARLEDLDTVATRFADAFVTGRAVEQTARLGTITEMESKPDRRREGESGFGFGLGGVAPVGDGYAEAGMGVLVDFTYWFEARWFAIGPRVGVRFSAAEKDGGKYAVVPIDVTGFYILSLGDVAPFFGLGGGIRYFWEERPATITVGNVIPMTHDTRLSDSAWGFGAFGRVGLLFLRTYAVRLTVWADYDATFVKLNGRKFPQALTFGLGILY